MKKSLLFGALFGFVLSRAGLTDYDTVAGMFRFTDLHLMGVIAGAIALSAAAFATLRWRGARSLNGEPLALEKKPMRPRLIAGSLLFGAGWGVAGTCPGTALAQIGDGHLAGLCTLAGILIGSLVADARPLQRSEPRAAGEPSSAATAAG